MATEWAHLPNAKHIDQIVKFFTTHDLPDGHYKRGATQYETWDDLFKGQHDKYRDAWDDLVDYLRAACTHCSWDIATDAVLPLVVQPDCAYILDLHPDVVRLMAASGNQPAILMEAAVIAMHKENV